MKRSRWRVALLAGIASFLIVTCMAQEAPDGAILFLETCAPCHTIGGGERDGPDLLPTSALPRDEIHAAVTRMQEDYTDALTPEKIDALVDLLMNRDAQQLLADAESGEGLEQGAAGSVPSGQRLFFGDEPLANGGTPCFACHAVNGRGGNLAADLTLAASRLGISSIRKMTERPAFPSMKAAYLGRQVTAAAVLCLLGLVILLWRRAVSPAVRAGSTFVDFVVLAILIAQVAIGLSLATMHRWGALWSEGTTAPYLRSLATLQPEPAYVAGTPLLLTLHLVGAWVVLALIPFSRLIHMFLAPLQYLWRPPQKVMWLPKS